jgi:hypothetical protein
MREYPIPHGEQYLSCILRRWKSDRSATGLIRKMLSRLFPSPNKDANQFT